MPPRELPDRPNLDQYKKQAKELVKAAKAGDARAFVLMREHHPRLKQLPEDQLHRTKFALADAQLVVARAHGFDSWPKFAKHIEAITSESSSRIWTRTPKNIVKVAEALLDAGADINATADMYGGGSATLGLAATSIHPVTAGVQDELMAFLLARGASRGGDKGTAAWSKLINACHANGRPGAAEFLARRADGLDLEAAAGVGRLDIVKAFFDANGRLTANATKKQMEDGFTWACEYGRTDVVEFLLQRGMDVAAKLRHHRQTGMHWAAYGGYADTVRVLLRHKAPVNVKDDTFEGTPLGWALYAWAGGGPHAGDRRYYDVVKLLVAAGATVATEWLNEDERDFPIAKRIREDSVMRAALGGKLGSTAGPSRWEDDQSET